MAIDIKSETYLPTADESPRVAVVPRTARASVLDGVEGTFLLKGYPVPTPAPGTILLRVELSGICGTDMHIYHGRMPGVRYPLILGHEVVGTIAALGEGIETDLLGVPVKVGDRVCPIGAMSCNECYYCTVLHSPNRCRKEETFGFYPDPDKEPYLLGGYAEYLYIKRKNPPFIKTSAPPEIGMLLDSYGTGFHAVQRGNVRNGVTVVVQGTGTIGICTMAAAKIAGAAKVIAVGGPKERLDYAKLFGADVTIDIADVIDPRDRIAAVRELTVGRYGADIVFGCTGTVTSIKEGLAYTRDSGTYCEVGNFCDTGEVSINMGLEVVQRNINILGIFAQTIEHFARGLADLETGVFPFEKICTHKVPLERVEEVIKNRSFFLDGKTSLKVAIDPWM